MITKWHYTYSEHINKGKVFNEALTAKYNNIQTVDLLNAITLEDIKAAKREIIKSGIYAKFGNRTVIESFREILNLIGDQDFKHFGLNKTIAENGIIPRDFH